MAANGNSGNSTGQSAASAQAAAAAGNAAASNAANGNGNGGSNSSASTNTSGTTGNTSTGNTSSGASSGATNSAGLMGSLIGFGNAVAKGEVGNGGGGGSSDSKSDSKKSDALSEEALRNDKIVHNIQNIFTSAEKARGRIPSYIADEGDKAYTDARKNGKTEAEAQAIARNVVDKALSADTPASSLRSSFITLADGKGIRNADAAAFEGKNTGPTYDPSVTARANTNPTIAKGSSNMGPSAPASPAANNAPGGNIGGETGGIAGGETAAPSISDATNTGVTNRGSTVANGGTSVTDSGTGGSISSSISTPSRDASSIGLGVYNTDRANYDQDNWNRGMEVESSSLVSDEECKAFAKRAFMENSEPFKKVRVTILKKC